MNIIKVNKDNLDFIDSRFKDIEYWYLELDENKKVKREIGFNGNNEPVIFLPNEKAPYGFWGDSPITFNANEWDKVDLFEFMSFWRSQGNSNVA